MLPRLGCCCESADSGNEAGVFVEAPYTADLIDANLRRKLLGEGGDADTHNTRLYQYGADLDRRSGNKLGLAVKQNPHTKLLQVMSVEGGDTAADVWNAEFGKDHEDTLRTGDFILSVNSYRDLCGIVLECKKTALLRFVLCRVCRT
eukprot:CAMPEP_0194485998 /NCGR_PEP_ID=MMETSP0253-20130528/6809_1 /TAXON_ID=2966 /ORGANISM="Noctiluca scintillans" /LENGTH=146 /DNA_ID=CAMNT_0039326031 /DNA_START=1 /DNA_END=441 /DNA_ORIENTATION=-